jgi:uncharacterized protein YlaI
MLVPWEGNKCILCGRVNGLTKEHLIPQSIGGKLYTIFLCKKCNDELGRDIEYAIRTDPSIRIAAHRLADKIPVIADMLSERQQYIGYSKGGKVKGIIKNGEFRVREQKENNGSLRQPTDRARRSIEKILKKITPDIDIIKKALDDFDKAPEDTRIHLAKGLEFAKWRLKKVEPLLDGKPMDIIVPLKIAFEFLALHLATAIYAQHEELNEIKKAILERFEDSKSYRVEYLRGENYAPFHGIVFEGNHPHAVVQVRLFGFLAYRVHFLRIDVGGKRYVYTHYLDTNCEDIRELPANEHN